MTEVNYKKILEEDRMELLMRYPFYGRVVCKCELRVSASLTPISGNDCKRIFLSERQYFALNSESRIQILSHEVLHIALRHAFRCANRDQERFSFASDAEIYFLLKEQFNLPDAPVYDEDWKDLTAEEIYERLPINLPIKPQEHFYPEAGINDFSKFKLPSNNQKDKNQSESFAEDEESDLSDSEDNNGDGDGNAGGKGDCNGDSLVNNSSNAKLNAGKPNSAGDDSQHDIPEFEKDSELFSRQVSAEILVEMEKGSGCGNCPGNVLRLLKQINTPNLDWRVLLRQFLRECRGGSYKWLPTNRRFVSKGLYLPGRSEHIFCGIIAIDTSGSTADELPDFIGEVQKLMRSFGRFELTVLECDTVIGNVTEISSFTPVYDWKSHRFSGGGGTDFTPVFQYIKEKRIHPNVLVFFTDGDGNCPEKAPGYPVLWLLTNEGEAPVQWGFKIKMKGHDYANN